MGVVWSTASDKVMGFEVGLGRFEKHCPHSGGLGSMITNLVAEFSLAHLVVVEYLQKLIMSLIW